MYNRFGPTPRICFGLLNDKARLAVYQSHYQAELEGLSLEVLFNMITEANKLNVEDISRILLMKRVPMEELIQANPEVADGIEFVCAGFEPITHAVKAKLYNEIQSKDRNVQLGLYSYLENVVGMRRIAELVFRSLAHSKLQKEIKLELFPMVKEESGGSDHSNM